jgi:catalase
LSDTDRQHLVYNIATHLGNVKSAEIKARQRTFFSFSHPISRTMIDAIAVAVFAAVDQRLSDAIARAIGAPTVLPLAVAPATEVVPLKTNIGQKTVTVV